MSTEARHRITSDHLRTTLERMFSRRVKALRRRLCAYASSYTVENLDVTLAGGRKLRVVLKDVSPPSVLATAQQVRPHFLYNPGREIEVYKKVLDSSRDGTARFLGAVNSPDLERHWLFLERVDGRLLWQVGDLNQWDAAARWLAGMHARHRKHSLKRCPTLLRFDREFFGVWIVRAENFLRKRRAEDLKRFTKLAKGYDRLIGRIAALPAGFVHGEFYASNVIIRAPRAKEAVCAIDWEAAGVGPFALDLAALTAGEWEEREKRRFVTAYREGLRTSNAPSVAELLEMVELCQLHLSVQMLGWAEDWSPPEQHAQNWLREALRLADKLGIV